jgi:hypothetical protein
VQYKKPRRRRLINSELKDYYAIGRAMNTEDNKQQIKKRIEMIQDEHRAMELERQAHDRLEFDISRWEGEGGGVYE